MKTSKKTMLVIAVTLLLAAALFVGAGAATGATQDGGDVAKLVNGSGTTYFTTFADAYAALTKGDNAAKPKNPEVITLLKNTTTGGFGLDADKNMNYVVDLGGFTLTVTTPGVGSTGYETQAVRLTQGSDATFKNGTLTMPESNVTATEGAIKQFVHNYGAMTLEDVTIDGTYTQQAVYGDDKHTGATYTIAAGNPSNYDSLTIKGNTVIKAPNNSSLVDDQPRIALEAATTGTTKIEADGDDIPEILGDIESAAATTDFTISAGSFTDLANAVKYAAASATIALADDVTGPCFKIGDDGTTPRTITIDLDENTYTFTTPAVGSAGHATQGIRVGNTQTVTIKNGGLAIDSKNPSIAQGKNRIVWLFNNYGTLTLENVEVDGTYVNQNMDFTKKENVKAVLFSNTGKVDITGKTSITAPTGVPALYVGWFKDYPGKAEITSDGGAENANETNASICEEGTDATINTTGTIDGAVAFKMYYSDAPSADELANSNLKLTVKAGNLKGSLEVDTNETFADYAKSTGIKISGGSFTDPTVAQYVQSDNSISVKLDKNYGANEAGCHVIVPTGATVTLDLNGKTINGGKDANSGDKDKDKATITNAGTLTIKDSAGNGVIKRADAGATDLGYYVIVNNGTLTIESGKVTNTSYCESAKNGSSLIINALSGDATLTINGGEFVQSQFNVIKSDDYKSTITINGGKITCDKDYAILTYGTLTINDGEIQGPVGVFGIKKTTDILGNATINGGKFTVGKDVATNAKGIAVVAYSGSASGYSKPDGKPSATIKGGNFGAGYNLIAGTGDTHGEVSEDTTKGTLSVEGGIFKEDPSKYLDTAKYTWDKATGAVGKIQTPKEDGTVTPTGDDQKVPGAPEGTKVTEISGLPTEEGKKIAKVTYSVSEAEPGETIAKETLASIDINVYKAGDTEPEHSDLGQTVTVKFSITNPDATKYTDASKLAVYHKKATGGWEKVDATITITDGKISVVVKTTSFSAFAIVEKAAEKKSSSSTPQGSSVWLTEPVQPTATPTPTPTATPDVPGVKPVTPTGTPAKTPAPFLGILAGLGAAAVVFGLRRK